MDPERITMHKVLKQLMSSAYPVKDEEDEDALVMMLEDDEEEDEEDEKCEWRNRVAREYCDKMCGAYGKPDSKTDHHAAWRDIAGFKKVVIKDEALPHATPEPHADFVYGTRLLPVKNVPGIGVVDATTEGTLKPSLLSDFALFTGAVMFDLLKGEVTARCGNLLAVAITLQWVDDVIDGKAKANEYSGRIRRSEPPAWYLNELDES